MEPIGVVRSLFTPDSGDKWSVVADVVLDEEYAPALDGIEDYSHIIVIFWMDRIAGSTKRILKTHPRGREDMPVVGIFATRGKARPNPIGLAVVELVAREGNVLKVKGLDAFDGTPILDIKPYDRYDVKEDIRMPAWWMKMTTHRGGKR